MRYGVSNLYRYAINDLNDTTRDTWEQVGVYWGGPGAKASCGMDPVGKTFVRTAVNSVPFVYWDLGTPGPGNRDVPLTPADPDGEFSAYLASGARDISDCGLDFDPKRRQYALWCGDGRVWMLKPPATPAPAGWVITQQRTPLNAVPNGDVGTGILGKWKYIDNLDVFIGVQDIVQGNVWVYKPVGWQRPGGSPANLPPTVAIGRPTAGATAVSGAPITITADASDRDGSVVRVEFFNGSTKIGEATAAPYQTTWATAPVGSWTLSALATDDRAAQTRSAGIAVTVSVPASLPPPPGGTTVLLQRGQNGYLRASDTYLSSYHTTLAFGAHTLMQDYSSSYSVLTRFAIFQSEGGPVPDGARIESATLSLYKYTAYSMGYSLHPLLRDWQEESASWTQSTAGAPWTAGGAGGAGSDYAATPDATAQTGFDPGWLNFDVTAGVQRMSSSASTTNYGWKLRGVSGYVNGNKRFYTSEYAGDSALRPKLEVRYR